MEIRKKNRGLMYGEEGESRKMKKEKWCFFFFFKNTGWGMKIVGAILGILIFLKNIVVY